MELNQVFINKISTSNLLFIQDKIHENITGPKYADFAIKFDKAHLIFQIKFLQQVKFFNSQIFPLLK